MEAFERRETGTRDQYAVHLRVLPLSRSESSFFA